MTLLWIGWLFAMGAVLLGVLLFLCDGSTLQPTARETLLRRCEEQHAAIMRGDMKLGVYGKYPPADLSPPRSYTPTPAPTPYHPERS